MERLKAHVMHHDDRGTFRGIVNAYKWGEINHVSTHTGAARGNHYHLHTKELFYILSGKVKVDVKNIATGEERSFVGEAESTFIVEPGEVHTLTALEESTWLNMLSEPMDAQHPDFHKPPS